MILLLLLTSIIILRFFSSIPSLGWKMLCMNHSPKIQTSEEEGAEAVSLLDLPDPILDTILERLPPNGLCKMAAVSIFFREKCISDHFWDRHMKQKWGRIIGLAAYQDWQRHLALISDSVPDQKQKGFIRCISQKLYQTYIVSRTAHRTKLRCPLPVDSVLSWYLALENGTFWFPAQIYNRQNGHVGFSLSCYDARLSYDHQTDTFQARYPAYEMLEIPIEKNVTWDSLRAPPPVDTNPYDLFHSDSLNELSPGDHIEIQWRINKKLPYGWWYGVVGHLDSCDRIEANCHCSTSDIIVLEFNQYSTDSRWRMTLINRREHREKGNEADGFYGGVRKLESRDSDEISTWQRLWPSQVLQGL
ncbi:unnamed protein product [Rhodiola kirilowii]